MTTPNPFSDPKMFDALGVPTLTVGADGKVRAMNEAATEACGKSADQVVGKKSWAAFFAKRGPTPVDECMATGEPVEGELTLADGSKHWIIARPVFDDDDEVSGAVATFSSGGGSGADDARLKGALEAATSSVMVADADLNIVYCNPSAFEMFKAAEDDIREIFNDFSWNAVVGKNIDIFHKNPAHQRRMLDGLSSTHRADIAVGKRTFGIVATPVFDEAHSKSGFVVEWIDKTAALAKAEQERAAAADMARVKSSLDKTSTNVMIADNNYNIVYMNDSVTEMFTRNERELKAILPALDVKNLIGANIDIFHKNPAHQRGMLEKLSQTYKTEMNLAGLTLQIVANPVFDANGERQGTVVEWEDLTQQRADDAEKKRIQDKIERDAIDLQRKVDLLLDVVSAAADGDFSKEVPDFGQDAVGQLASGIRSMIGNVQSVVDETKKLIDAAQQGRLDERGDADGFRGGYREMVAGFNATLDAIMAPVNEAGSVLEQLAAYDLRARVTGEFSGDHNRIKDALNSTGQVLHDSMGHVSESVEQILSASDQIAKSSQDVADGAANQASSLEETSSSLEEMASMTKQNADNALQADGMAKAASEAATRGGEAMDKMIGSMGKIRQSSEDTSAIIKDINEIAFQTNLLALNAAVEAARAGDAGRGFAVVAEEVRNLAQRSKEAAQKTETLINQSVKLAGEGEKITEEATARLNDISDGIGKVVALVAEIAAASQEQARGIDQVNTAMTNIDRVTQANASASEEMSSAAEELAAQARELSGMVGRFQLDGSGHKAGRSAPAPAPTVRPKLSGPGHAEQARASNGSSHNGWADMKPEDLIPLDGDPVLASF
jgi:methyl-accepting chemotaxis protein